MGNPDRTPALGTDVTAHSLWSPACQVYNFSAGTILNIFPWLVMIGVIALSDNRLLIFDGMTILWI